MVSFVHNSVDDDIALIFQRPTLIERSMKVWMFALHSDLCPVRFRANVGSGTLKNGRALASLIERSASKAAYRASVVVGSR
jgi:hypothetical protein